MNGQCGHCEKKNSLNLLILRTVVAAVCSFPLLLNMLGLNISLPIQAVLATIVQVYSGYPFYIGTLEGLKKRSANMDTLVALGTTAAYLFSFYIIFSNPGRGIYFETSSLLITFILFGKVIEARSVKKAESGMKALLDMQPEIAHIKQADEYIDIAAKEVKKDDIFMVRPGERVPVDGKIVEGESTVDESMLTGESLASQKSQGYEIFAGTINQHGTLTVVATKVGGQTALSRIIHLVEQAKKTKAPIERLADKVSGIFVPMVLLVAALTFILWALIAKDPRAGLINSIAVLVIACPCALGLATPIVIFVASSRAALMGIFIKNATAIETAQKITTILVDKTNTVTEGILSIEKMDLNEKYIPLVKALAHHSEHPASAAIVDLFEGQMVHDVDMLAFRSTPGKGVSGYFDKRPYYLGSPAYLKESGVPIESLSKSIENELGSVVGFGTERLLIGYFVLSDAIKEGTGEAINALQKLGIETIMLTGDRYKVAEHVANELHFNSFKAEVLPEQKAEHVKKTKELGKVVGMVGDGVNDAPALAMADVGFAIASGTDVAMESASVGLMHSHLSSVVDMILLSKISYKKIIQNLAFAFGYNTLGIPLAAFGFLNPIIAGVAMALSSISVVLNALHLNKIKLFRK